MGSNLEKWHHIHLYWFEKKNERAQTMRYVEFLKTYWTLLGQWKGKIVTLNNCLTWIRFQKRPISRKCEVWWTPHLSNLNTPDLRDILKTMCNRIIL